MSNRDKIDFLQEARGAGYRTYLYYICTDSPLINRERVAARVQQGGHNVAPGKIKSRYARSLSLLPEAIKCSARAYLFDNSGEEHVFIAEFEHGKLIWVDQSPPAWFANGVLAKFEA